MADNLFEQWRLLQHPDQSEDEVLLVLKEHIKNLAQPEQELFLTDLLNSGLSGDELALEALQEIATPQQREIIANATTELLNQEPEVEEAFKLPYFIRILLATPGSEHEELLKKYFLEYPMGTWWDIPNQLYDRSQSIFLKAYARYLETLSQNDVVHFHGITRLIYVPKALKFLVKNLPPELRPLLKAFAKSRAKQKWLPEEIRQMLTEIANS